MIKKIKRLWKLSNKKPEDIDLLLELKDKEIDLFPDEGNGKATFFSEGTDEDFDEYEKENKGLAAFYKRIKEL